MKIVMPLIGIVAGIFIGGTVSAQRYDTLPYTVDVPQYFMMNSFDSMHVMMDPAGAVLIKKPTLSSLFLTNDSLRNVDYVSPTNMLDSTGDYALGMYSGSTIRIGGVAWSDAYRYEEGRLVVDSAEVRIYVPEGKDSLVMLVSKRVSYDTIITQRIYAPWRGWNQQDSLYLSRVRGASWVEMFYPVTEVYFDREYDVIDSFYVSITHWFHDEYGGMVYRTVRSSLIMGWVEMIVWSNAPGIPRTWSYPIQTYIMRDNGAASWVRGEYHAYPLVFPIISRDCDSCPEVRNMRWSAVGATAAFVQWDAGTNHRDWQLCHGPAGTAPGAGTVVDCPLAQSVVPGIASDGQCHDVYVRARCRFARDEWSAWQGPLTVGQGCVGVDGVQATGVELSPNPASSILTATAAEPVDRVDVYDLTGRMVLSVQGSGAAVQLDVSQLPAGKYTARISTPGGTAVRPLVVAR